MKIFVVNYDLRNARNYETLYRRLESLGGKRVLESMWTLKLSDTNTCAGLRDDLLEYMDSDDGIYVACVSSSAWHKPDNQPHRYEE